MLQGPIHKQFYDRSLGAIPGVVYWLPGGSMVRIEQNSGWRAVQWSARLGAVAALALVMDRHKIESAISGQSCVSIDWRDMPDDIEKIDETTAFWRVDTTKDGGFQWEESGDRAGNPLFCSINLEEKELGSIVWATATKDIVMRIAEIDLSNKNGN